MRTEGPGMCGRDLSEGSDGDGVPTEVDGDGKFRVDEGSLLVQYTPKVETEMTVRGSDKRSGRENGTRGRVGGFPQGVRGRVVGNCGRVSWTRGRPEDWGIYHD